VLDSSSAEISRMSISSHLGARGLGDFEMKENKYKTNFQIITEAYLKQPIFDRKVFICLNPLKFRKDYRLKLLERCWQLDYETETYRLRLENCWQKAGFESATATVLQSQRCRR